MNSRTSFLIGSCLPASTRGGYLRNRCAQVFSVMIPGLCKSGGVSAVLASFFLREVPTEPVGCCDVDHLSLRGLWCGLDPGLGSEGVLHPGDAHPLHSLGIGISRAEFGTQQLRLQWKGRIVVGACDEQQRRLWVASCDLVAAGDEVEAVRDRSRGVAPRIADVEPPLVGR